MTWRRQNPRNETLSQPCSSARYRHRSPTSHMLGGPGTAQTDHRGPRAREPGPEQFAQNRSCIIDDPQHDSTDPSRHEVKSSDKSSVGTSDAWRSATSIVPLIRRPRLSDPSERHCWAGHPETICGALRHAPRKRCVTVCTASRRLVIMGRRQGTIRGCHRSGDNSRGTRSICATCQQQLRSMLTCRRATGMQRDVT